MNRRQFSLLALGSVLTGSAIPFSTILAERKRDVLQVASKNKHLFSAYDNEEGQHFISRLAFDGEGLDSSNMESMQIPFRAHDTLLLSQHQSLSFGRRPHNQMIVCDFKNNEQHIIDANEGRHFYGHGCIDKKQNILFTGENAYGDGNLKNNKGKGVVGIRDSKSFKLIGEYESYGIGPHDIHLMPDNKTLVVANGGIQTHPDYGRRKLNLASMQPSLVFIDKDSGKKIDEYRLENPKLSIRHLSISTQGDVGIATQYQGPLSANTPDFLLAFLGKDGLRTMNHTQQFTRDCQGYIGDVAIDSNAQIMAASSPRGNNISLWDIKEERLIKTIQISGPCGLCFDAQNQEFLVSNEKGGIYKIGLNLTKLPKPQVLKLQALVRPLESLPIKWDNHMMIGV